MKDLSDSELSVILIALGRTRQGMPDPTMIDTLAEKIDHALEGKGGQLYEMAKGAPMGERTKLIERLVAGAVIEPREPLTMAKVQAMVEAVDRHRRYDAWLAGRTVDSEGVERAVVADAGAADYEMRLPGGERHGPRLVAFIENFVRIQERFTYITGIPAAWCLWEYDTNQLEAEWAEHQKLVDQTPDDKAPPKFKCSVYKSDWFVQVQAPDPEQPEAKPLEFWVQVNDAGVAAIEVSHEGYDLSGPASVLTTIKEVMAR